MPRAEMVHNVGPLSQARPSTPPNLSLSENILTFSSTQQIIEMVKAIVAMEIAPTTLVSKCTCSHTPAETPTQAAAQPLTVEYLEQLILKLTAAKSSDSVEVSVDPQTVALGEKQPEEVVAVASELEFKTVDELWDEKAHKYAIVESLKPVGQGTGLDQYVFVVRRRVDKKTKETTCYIDIKSELLRDILRDVLRDVGGISVNESKPSIEQNLLYTTLPELALCQGWYEVATLYQPGTEHLGLLVTYLKSTYADTAQSLLSLLSTGHITYHLLWALFKPNSLVYTTCSGTQKPRCVKYNFGEERTTTMGMKYWSLNCRYLDFNGEGFGSVAIELKIPKFRGGKQINALEAFPLPYHADPTGVRADLLRCGLKFMSLMGSRHRECHGTAFYMRDGEPVQVPIDGRIMVDAAFFRKMSPSSPLPKLIDLSHDFDISDWQKLFDSSSDQASSEASSDSSSGTYFDPTVSDTSSDQAGGSVVEQAEMTEENFLICFPTVPGFSLSDKLWAEFAVADIKDIEWSSVSFDCLTIPDEQREMIMAMAEVHTSRQPDSGFDDIVDGKGRGVNVLLHGEPGVGKTLTAEAVSESLRKPLYSISAGELSTDAGRLENQLYKIFRMAEHWGAILLIDEADVYLERRAPQDLVRNGLVSVFLRTMEYCSGTMFLTTNRVSQFDEAILSRIHLMLQYDSLSSVARKKIWGNFLSRAGTAYGAADVCAKEMERLVSSKLNGRQIKNAVATARALAVKQKCPVGFSQLEKAVKVSENFMSEFNGTQHTSSVFA